MRCWHKKRGRKATEWAVLGISIFLQQHEQHFQQSSVTMYKNKLMIIMMKSQWLFFGTVTSMIYFISLQKRAAVNTSSYCHITNWKKPEHLSTAVLEHDKTWPHSAYCMLRIIALLLVRVLDHLFYYPEMALGDFHLIRPLNLHKHLGGRFSKGFFVCLHHFIYPRKKMGNQADHANTTHNEYVCL